MITPLELNLHDALEWATLTERYEESSLQFARCVNEIGSCLARGNLLNHIGSIEDRIGDVTSTMLALAIHAKKIDSSEGRAGVSQFKEMILCVLGAIERAKP